MRNTAEMPRMATEIRPINSADVVRVAPVVPVVLVALAVSVVLVALVVSEDLVEPAVRAVLVVSEDPAVRAALVVPAARAVLVVSESPAVPVALVLVRGHPRAQLAVALRTKSVTAARRLDLVPLLEAGEDLAAAVAATTREPAAAEAATAWEVVE
jgi:hypothetical protein